MTGADIDGKILDMTSQLPISALTAKREAFAQALADPTCKSASEAYCRAFDAANMKAATVASRASEMAATPNVAARIRELRDAAAAKAMSMGPLDVLREWVTIATADPSELTCVRRWCCRHCYGIDHAYQWINDDEYAVACAKIIDLNANRGPRQHERPMPDDSGGVGFQRNRDPVKTCPLCHGDGEWDTYVADTMGLSPAGRKLFAGVKQTRHGVEVKMRDQDGALLNIAKYLGMLAERHMLGGDPANRTPIPTTSVVAELSPQDASKLYARIMEGK